jgi:SAM-dependent methyltransferase
MTAIYDELADWYHLIDPAEDHADEALCYRDAFARGIDASSGTAGRRRTLLDLGAGAGNNASFLKAHFTCTLADLSPAMLALSQARNPECEHVHGDMRTLRLGRVFDAVLVHDAVCYMTSEADLAAAMATAFVHTRPGGAAIFTPDVVAETFGERSELIEHDDGVRSLRAIEWQWDPDPADATYCVEFALLLREGGGVRMVHDRHLEGLHARATWVRLLAAAGYVVETVRRPIGDGETDEIFLCRRPAAPA